MGRPPKPPPPRRPNPLTNMKPIRKPTPIVANNLARKAIGNAAKAKQRDCPNKLCEKSNVVDGICEECGYILFDSAIVSEVQFGENSSGAAVVQGSFVSADQGTAKSLGPAFRRAGGQEDREKSLREAKRIMTGFAGMFGIHENIVSQGVQVFKLASMQNFVQGRRLMMVAAVCLYTAARQNEKCTVMMIDFADACSVNVFKLGHCFKKLHEQITLQAVKPVLPEDLIYRFATKLEFGSDTEMVAETAIRLAQRMALDWMVMGRRPSGVCGACLIMAARMHNFRRTVKEVVYIVKVTTHTIQKRLDEFKVTDTSDLTVEAFLKDQFLESAHDPPSFYEKSAAFQAQKKQTRKRLRPLEWGDDEDDAEDEQAENANHIQEPGPEQREALAELASKLAEVPPAEFGRDEAGFLRPPLPPPRPQATPQLTTKPTNPKDIGIPIDPTLLETDEADDPRALESLVAEHGDILELADEDGADEAESSSPNKRGPGRPSTDPSRSRGPQLPIDADWQADEDALESEITEMISDPHSLEHAKAFKAAEKRASIHVKYANVLKPQKTVSMEVNLDEDEFDGDPEVENCILTEAEAKIKEKIWVNENKDWLRDQQRKMLKKKEVAMGPPKATRKRKKKARIGEGQTSPAASPAEAAVAVAKDRFWSKKINYDAIRSLFDRQSYAGSLAAASQRTSRAGSSVPSEIESTVAPSVAGDSVAGESEAAPSSVAASEAGSTFMDDMRDVDADFEGPDLDDAWREHANDSD